MAKSAKLTAYFQPTAKWDAEAKAVQAVVADTAVQLRKAVRQPLLRQPLLPPRKTRSSRSPSRSRSRSRDRSRSRSPRSDYEDESKRSQNRRPPVSESEDDNKREAKTGGSKKKWPDWYYARAGKRADSVAEIKNQFQAHVRTFLRSRYVLELALVCCVALKQVTCCVV